MPEKILLQVWVTPNISERMKKISALYGVRHTDLMRSAIDAECSRIESLKPIFSEPKKTKRNC